MRQRTSSAIVRAPNPGEDTLPGMTSTAALAYAALVREARLLAPAAFRERFGAAFLLHEGTLDPMGRLSRQQNTMLSRIRRTDLEGHPTSPRPLMAFSVRPTGRSVAPGYVFVGRAKTNDVVLTDFSVSKVHAVFCIDPGGTISIADSRSKNGTFVNDARVYEDVGNAPTALESGALVRFGAVEFTFVYAHDLRVVGAGSANTSS